MEVGEPARLKWSSQPHKAADGESGEVPSKRSGHSFTVITQKGHTSGFLFGGLTGADGKGKKAGASADLYKLNLGSSVFEWTLASTTGTGPGARWKHSATIFEDSKIIFFGGFHSNIIRFNDLFILDTVKMHWEKPLEDLAAATPRGTGNHKWKTKEPVLNAPTPRGAHSATLIKNAETGPALYVFGGYGGMGYARKDFDDFYMLNLKQAKPEWVKVQAKGKAPDKRSGHQACAVQQKVYIFGGWNASTQFSDLHIFDTETQSWSETTTTFPSMNKDSDTLWNHAACSVVAIPK
jgi:dynein heavy chain